MADHCEAIVVGAGPAGNAAALTMARAGLDVLQLERAAFPGAGSSEGSLLWAPALEKLIGDFRSKAPLERRIREQRVWRLEPRTYTSGPADGPGTTLPDRYTILRAPFEAWFSSTLKEAGVRSVFAATVAGVIREADGRVIGVQTADGGEFYADAVVLAEGVESLVARQAGLREDLRPEGVAVTVTELRRLPRAVLEGRFGIEGDDGVAIEAGGELAPGVHCGGFVYTNCESLSVGVGCLLDDLVASEWTPSELLDGFKQHPSIKALLADSEAAGFCARLSPEGGYRIRPRLFGDGWLTCGDAMQPGSPVHRAGATLALASGRLAGETVVELMRHGRPMTARHLSLYRDKLERSALLKMLQRHQPESEQEQGRTTADPRRLAQVSRGLWRAGNENGRGRQRLLLRRLAGKLPPRKVIDGLA